jgi:hypothetical protein
MEASMTNWRTDLRLAILAAALSAAACTPMPMHFGPTHGLVSLVVLVFDIIAIIQVVQSGLSGTVKLLWVLVILFLPLIGMLLWFILGKRT